MREPLCPVCGEPTNPKPYGPFFTPDPVYRWADTCQSGDWRGAMRATIAPAKLAAALGGSVTWADAQEGTDATHP